MLTTLALAAALLSTPAQADVVIYLGAPPPPHHRHVRHQVQDWVWIPRHRDHHGHWVAGHWARVPAHAPHRKHRRRR